MQVDILNGAASLEIGNPNKALSQIIRGRIMAGRDADSNAPYDTIYPVYLARFICGVEGVAVNDPDNPEANLVWQLWDSADTSHDYERLYMQFLELDTPTVTELGDVLHNAIEARYAAPPELSTPEELLDPNSESAVIES